jgi:hypothetical protein
MGRVKKQSILSDLALLLGITEQVLISKLFTINALLLEKARREGVEPKELFEGCFYVPKEVRELLGEHWQEELKRFMKEVQIANIEEPIEEAIYWIRKLSIERQSSQNRLREMSIFIEEDIIDEFVKVANKAIELGIIKAGHEQKVGEGISNMVKNYLQRETKLLKDRILRQRVKGR